MRTSNLAAALLLASASSAAVADAPFQADPPTVHAAQYAPRFEPDCADFVFEPEDQPVSKPVTLTSQEWLTDCVPAGSGSAGEDCWEQAGRSDSLLVRLSLAGRPPLLPWESDAFRACLTGPALSVVPVSTAYDYRLAGNGALDGNIVFVAGPKRAQPPDPRGVQAVLTPGLTLAFHDRWAAYYPGEEIVLEIALKKEIHFLPDETVAEKEVTLPVAETYAVELGGAARTGGNYYARYSIIRLGGSVSTEDETPVLQTGKVPYDPE